MIFFVFIFICSITSIKYSHPVRSQLSVNSTSTILTNNVNDISIHYNCPLNSHYVLIVYSEHIVSKVYGIVVRNDGEIVIDKFEISDGRYGRCMGFEENRVVVTWKNTHYYQLWYGFVNETVLEELSGVVRINVATVRTNPRATMVKVADDRIVMVYYRSSNNDVCMTVWNTNTYTRIGTEKYFFNGVVSYYPKEMNALYLTDRKFVVSIWKGTNIFRLDEDDVIREKGTLQQYEYGYKTSYLMVLNDKFDYLAIWRSSTAGPEAIYYQKFYFNGTKMGSQITITTSCSFVWDHVYAMNVFNDVFVVSYYDDYRLFFQIRNINDTIIHEEFSMNDDESKMSVMIPLSDSQFFISYYQNAEDIKTKLIDYELYFCWENFNLTDNCDSCYNEYSTSSLCQDCKDNYDIDSLCTTCEGNWDVRSGCSQCIEGYEDRNGDDCMYCVDHWDIESNCTSCTGKWNFSTNCLQCENNWENINYDDCGYCNPIFNESNDCLGCSFHRDPDTGCTLCTDPLYDISDDCLSCINNYVYDSIHDNCTCPPRFTIDSDCLICADGLSGGDCSEELTNYFFLTYSLDEVLMYGGIIVAIFVAIIMCLCIVLLCCLCRKRRKQKLSAQDLAFILLEKEENKSFAKFNINKSLFLIKYEDIELKRVLGEGSGGSVYLGIWENKEVAIKMFRFSVFDTQTGLNTFEKEVEVMSSISHPNVVSFYGCSTHPPKICLVMEYCKNGDIEKYILRKNYDKEIIPFKKKLGFIKGICDGMLYLEKRNIIHRDLKLLNVLLDSRMNIKLTDFGCARIIKDADVKKTRLVGTTNFISPEVFFGGNYDSKADVFSFSIIIWEIMHDDVNPYGKDISDINDLKVANDEDHRPKVNKSKFPKRKLLDMMKSMWKGKPEDRPSFEEIREILESL